MAEAKLIPPSREEARQLLFALRYEAKKAVKADMKGRGLKLWDIESKTITTEAVVYLRNDWRVLLPKAQNGRPRNQRLRRCKCRCKMIVGYARVSTYGQTLAAGRSDRAHCAGDRFTRATGRC